MSSSDEFDPFAGGEVLATFTPTESQREIWTSAVLGDDANCAFNESLSLELGGALDPDRLEGALAQLVARHESLRMTFSDDGEAATVSEGVPIELRRVDGPLRELLRAEVTTPFDLVRGPLIRFSLVRRSAEDHVLVLTYHHIICDGWSGLGLLKDLSTLYESALGRAVTLGEPTSFSSYADRLRTLDLESSEAYWLGRYETLPSPLDLPEDRPRPSLRSFESDRLDRRLPLETLETFKRAAGKAGVSLFSWMLAGWFTFLRRASGAEDVVCAIPAAGQNASGMHSVVGHCVNLMPVRQSVKDLPFNVFAKNVQGDLYDALEHQEYTFGRLVRRLRVPRDPSRIPIVSVQFNLDPPVDPSALSFGGLRTSFRANPRAFENFELFLNLLEDADGLAMECQYNRNLFDRETVDTWLDAYVRILTSVAAEPERTVARVAAVASGDETVRAADDEATDPAISPLALFAEQVERVPDRVAVRSGEQSLTYRELDRRSDGLAALLRAKELRPDQLVALSARRDTDLLVGILGVWKAGASYVPLDPEFPDARLAFMIADARVEHLVTTAEIAADLPAVTHTVILDDALPEAASSPPGVVGSRAYVIYTSGSTGKPKGVEITMTAVSNFLQSMRIRPGLKESDVLVAVTTLSFDIAVFELLLPLVTGAQVVIADHDQARDPLALRELLNRSEATVMQGTPTTWQMLADSGWTPSADFKIVSGGEPFPKELARAFCARSQHVYNGYGPTESTTYSVMAKLAGGDQPITIGTPIHRTALRIVDANLEPVPSGVRGELLIGGTGLAGGYLNRPELTDERFIHVDGERFYRTGDLVRRRVSGELEFVRRIDSQVKVRGFRIELGEIEATLKNHPGVDASVAKVYSPSTGDTRLAAYFVPASGSTDLDALVENLRGHLVSNLPGYMVPQHLVAIDAVPLTPNRKVDRKALPDPSHSVSAEFAPPSTEAEKLLAAIWSDVLGVDRVGATDDFFALGGHSILATRVMARLREQTGVDLPLRRLFANPVLRPLADHLDALLAIQGVSGVGGDDREELSF
ncbi:MAG: amino acid adenylation domain-containing protein [Myxococcota bacterium]